MLLSLISLLLIFGCSTFSMIYGWGIEPKSWSIIIFVGWVPMIVVTGIVEFIKDI